MTTKQTSRQQRAEERMIWLLRRFAKMPFHGGVAWDESDVDDFVEAFPEAKATLIVYTMGPYSSPMLNRAAVRARDRGYLEAGHIGNMDAKSFNQRTWCRYWKLTDAGLKLVSGQ